MAAHDPGLAAFLRVVANPRSTLAAASSFYPYRTAVLANAPYLYWRLAETAGTAADDTSGNARSGTHTNTPVFAQSGPISAEPKDTALGTGTNGYVTSTASTTGPSTFTVEA